MHHGREPPPRVVRVEHPGHRGGDPDHRGGDPGHRGGDHRSSREVSGHKDDHDPSRRGHHRDHDSRHHAPGMPRRHSNDRHHVPQNGPTDRHRGGGPDKHSNGPPPPHHAPLSHPHPPKFTSYKLIIDPFIHKDVKEKVVRYDGEIPGDQHSITPTPVDPRKRTLNLWKLEKSEALDLPVPRFIIDSNYTGEPPKIEVTLDNLNDNVDKQFLGKTLQKFGETESIIIEYHPITNKHLGLARVVFKLVKGARQCVAGLHGKTMMGKEVNCYLDPRGMACAKMFDELTRIKEPTPPPPEPQHDDPPAQPEETNWEQENASWDQDWSRGKSWREDAGREEEGWRRPVWDNDDARRPGWDEEDARDAWEHPAYDDFRHGKSYSHRDRYMDSRTSYENSNSWHDRRGQNRGPERDQARGRRQDRGWRGQKHPDDEPRRDDEDSELQWSRRFPDTDSRFNDSQDVFPDPEKSSSLPPLNSALPLLPPPISASLAPQVEEAEQKFEEERSIDLDTRLQMLMKGKTANMPAFLLGSESSEAEQEPVPPPRPGPLSRTPSPFLTREQYMASHSLTLEQEELDRVNQTLANIQPFNKGIQDIEGMSPISDHEMGQHDFLRPGANQGFPGAPGYWQGHFPQPYQSWDPGEYAQGWGRGDEYGYENNQRYDEQMEETEQEAVPGVGKKGRKDMLKSIMDSVMKVVESELKSILNKDINKKLCESYAFLLFDKWWTEQETKYKREQELEFKKKAGTSGTTALLPDREKVEALPRIPKPEDLSNLIEMQRESGASTFGAGGSLGLGFRGSIPKFSKRIEKKPGVPDKHDKLEKNEKRDKSDKSKERKLEGPMDTGYKKKKDKHKEKEEEKEKTEIKKKSSSSTIYNAIYSESESDVEKKKESEESESSDVESSEKDSSDASDSSSSSSSDSESGSESSSDSDVVSAKSKSRSRSVSSERPKSPILVKSRSKSASRSKSPSPSVPTTPESTPLKAEPEKAIVLDSGSVSSSPIPSRPPTPDTRAAPKPTVIDVPDQSDTDTGSEVEILNEVSTPGRGTSSAVTAAEALVALSTQGPSTPVKIRHIESSPPHIMDHCYARPAPSKPRRDTVSSQDGGGGFDHDYTKPRTPPRAAPPKPVQPPKERSVAIKKSLPIQPVKFKAKDMAEKFKILYKFLTDGVDLEDVMYLKRSYEMMLNEGLNQPNLTWINDTHWVDHPITLIPDPPKKKRRIEDFSKPHATGSARTEGYYKMDPREKFRTKYHFHRPGVDAFNTAKIGHGNSQKPQKAISLSREARSQQRRMLTALGDEFLESDLLKFNQLKFRRKAMKFGKSAIHDWGLFAMENIGADEMVIEYVGEVVRPLLSDIREKRYEKQGIGSSYLFRIDLDYVVDATKAGNLARFINHSCEPNCYAKVIKIDGESKIVIYSKQPIAIGEEITYDYKFPIEDEKIRCLCGEKNCRKYLN